MKERMREKMKEDAKEFESGQRWVCGKEVKRKGCK
jgi:hypothetical protein